MSLRCWMGVVCAAMAAVLAAPPGAFAQSAAPGRVQGQVLDTTGQPLPGVRVELEALAGAPQAAQTSSDGRYVIESVPAGSYSVRFSLTSFVTLLRRNVAVSAGAATSADATLYVAATASVVVSIRGSRSSANALSDALDSGHSRDHLAISIGLAWPRHPRITSVMRRTLTLFSLAAALAVVPTLVSGQRASRDDRPNFEGVWNSATATPLERPSALKDTPFFTPEEAAQWERQFVETNEEPPPDTATTRTGTGTYNAFYREFGTRTVKTLRTSIVTYPLDGRIPALTPAAAEITRRRIERQRAFENPEELGLQDRCLAFVTAGPPMLPYSYNSNYQIIQTPDAVLVHAEMIHDARVIPLDGRPHLPRSISLWMGDSVGRWEGNTLVVDTTNFNDGSGFYGDAGGNFGWDRNLHVVERLSLFDPETLLYQFEIDDLTAFSQPWKGELTMTRSAGNIYEYACHEGNYSLTNMLSGYRAAERKPVGPAVR